MFEFIEFIICYGEGFTPEQVREVTRKQEIVYTRQLIMYFSKEYNVGSYAFIASKFEQDHATVNNALKVVKNYMDTDKEKKVKVEYYDKLIYKLNSLYKKSVDLTKVLDPLEKQISELEARCINLTLQLAFLKNNLKLQS